MSDEDRKKRLERAREKLISGFRKLAIATKLLEEHDKKYLNN